MENGHDREAELEKKKPVLEAAPEPIRLTQAEVNEKIQKVGKALTAFFEEHGIGEAFSTFEIIAGAGIIIEHNHNLTQHAKLGLIEGARENAKMRLQANYAGIMREEAQQHAARVAQQKANKSGLLVRKQGLVT